MKKLILVLTVAFMFVAGSAFSAVMNFDCFKAEETIMPATMGDFTFTLTIDTDANTMTMSDGVYPPGVGEAQGFLIGGTLPIDSIVGTTYSSVAYGSDDWPNPYASHFPGSIMGAPYELYLGNFVYDTATGIGSYACMPWDSAAHYAWAFTGTPSAIPIPAAAWLLLSGIVGIIGLRKRS